MCIRDRTDLSDRRRGLDCVNSIGIVGQTDKRVRQTAGFWLCKFHWHRRTDRPVRQTAGLDCVNSIGIIGQTDLSDRRRGLGCVNSTGIVGQTDLSDSIGIVGKIDGRVRQTARFRLCIFCWHRKTDRRTCQTDGGVQFV